MERAFVVDGHVTRRDTGGGVHGLTVEVWDETCCDEHCLGKTITNRDGSYRVRFCLGDDVTCLPHVFLRIRDREGRLIHDARSESCACLPAAPVTIDVRLASETLWWHNARPVSWEPPDGPLVRPRVRAEVVEALAAFRPNTPPSIVECIEPAIGIFDGLLNDAWATLQGDVVAGGRLRDVLEALCTTPKCGCDDGSWAEVVGGLFAAECAPEPDCGEPRQPAAVKGCGCGCDDCAGCEDEGERCPCQPRFVNQDHVTVLLMAGLQLACGHTETAKRYTITILDQVCQLGFLGALRRAARSALSGDELSVGHFGDLVELAATRCCVDDHHRCPSPRRPLGCCVGCLEQPLAQCLRDAICAWRSVECFSIDAITPARACPGETIVVCGSGFGETPGVVTFREHGTTTEGPEGVVEEWCCNSFTVRVPERAGCGMTVRLPSRTVEICGRFLEHRPFGCINAQFEGTSPDVLKFSVAGREDGDCVEPGTPLHISWEVCAADRIVVQVVDVDTGAVLDALETAPDRGHWDFDATDFTKTTTVRVELIAAGICEPRVVERQLTVIFQARPELSIHGVEVTQAIQHYRAAEHLTDPADRGPDNSLQLVTDKTAWVRVYLRSGQDPGFDNGQLAGVTGTLTVERRVGGVWGVVAVLAPQNIAVTAEESFVSYDAERGNIDSTLNFVVPANLMTGLLRFTVDVHSRYAGCPGNRASGSVICDVNLRQTLNAAFITIGYDGPNDTNTGTLTLAAPDLATCQAETAWAMRTYPVSGAANVRIAGTFTTNTPLDDPRSCPGCCSPNWGALLPLIRNVVIADQVNNPGPWAYYGIIANGIPVNVPGCNGVATGGIANQPITYAHEIGHQFGLPHARCGNAGAGNAAYPVYEPYDLPVDVPANPIQSTMWTMASIGEYGLDNDNGNIANPNVAEDFMSYCQPRWVSRFTHNFLVNNMGLSPQPVATGSGAGSQRVIRDTSAALERPRGDVEPLIVMVGLIDGDGGVTVLSVARLDARHIVGTGRPTPYRAQLVGADGNVLSEGRVYSSPVAADGDGHESRCCDDCGGRDDCGEQPTALFQAYLDDPGPGEQLRIVRCGETIWERTRPESSPTVSRVRARLVGDGDLQITWSAKCSTDDEEAWLRWSDDGETWHALTVVRGQRRVDVPAAQLPPGPIMVQVLVHDGFTTAGATSNTVELPARAPSVTILYPQPDQDIYLERQIHLWGAAGDVLGGAPPEAFAWYVDDIEVGHGPDIWVDNPGSGVHQVQLRVTTEAGTATAESVIDIPGGETPDE